MPAEVTASYLTIRPLAPGQTVHRTIQTDPGVLIDLDERGNVLGIERIGGPVDLYAAVSALMARCMGRLEPDSEWAHASEVTRDA